MHKFWILWTLICALTIFSPAQKLTVADIMREPSIAGMRADSVKLSPDGKFVVFSWNADGIEPRNLYIVSTRSGEPRMLVNAARNFDSLKQKPESKLNYGLTVKDDFAKAREKNLFGAEFSPDSKKLLFVQNGDLYTVDLEKFVAAAGDIYAERDAKWSAFDVAFAKRSDALAKTIAKLRKAKIPEKELFESTEKLNAEFAKNAAATKKGAPQKRITIAREDQIRINADTTVKTTDILKLPETYAVLKASKKFDADWLAITNAATATEKALADFLAADDRIKNGEKPRRITKTQGAEVAARWISNESILYASNGNLFSVNIAVTALTQLTKEANPVTNISVTGANISKNGEFLSYIVADTSKQRALIVPNYIDEFVTAPPTRRGFSDQKIFVSRTDGSLAKPYEIKLPNADGAGYVRSINWAADDRSVYIDRVDKDLKRRQLFFVENVQEPKILLVTEETDEKWIAPLSGIIDLNPKNARQVLFGSERSGFNHIYIANIVKAEADNAANTVKIEQITKGDFQIEWAKFDPSGNRVFFNSTEGNTAKRKLLAYDLKLQRTEKVNENFSGMRNGLALAGNEAETTVLFEGSNWNKPGELFSLRFCADCKNATATQLTQTIPSAFSELSWNEPQFTAIPTRDGKSVATKVYFPKNYQKDKKYPAVFFVHGAGYLQNSIDGWNNYYREFFFNQILTELGYVVLDIDYRGSAGYGRNWRTDVHDFLGGKDFEDHLDAIDYAVQNFGVDAGKIGAYGGSYGGFMAEMLAFRTDKITCAAALRPVADWKNYYASSAIYTVERLGFPEKNPEAYKRSSPITYANDLNKPLLILHGLVDDNVHAQDSIQLIEKLMRGGKTEHFEAMLYPAENHGFTRPSSWTDEYKRILAFFEKHLK